MKTNTDWDAQAKWYDGIVGEKGSYYHHEVIIPTLLKEMGNLENQSVLDLGCGQGFFCRILSEKKAKVVGIDLSQELIRLAKKYPNDRIQYYVANAEELSFLHDEMFDFIVSILSLGNMRDLDKVFREVARLLKTTGKFYFVIIHPCFRIPRQSQWEYDDNQKLQYRRIQRYLSELEIPIITHPGKVSRQKELQDQDYTIMFHRPLSVIMKHLKNHNLLISNLIELTSNKVSVGKRAKAENQARKEIPLFLLAEVVKKEVSRNSNLVNHKL
ncbi:MAG: class I SAM-dependent methyltransferase [Leptospiraceae bacterium]|nr:class I SAM-dependent methyltransferase [Leptospiraceae bacterium]MDW7976009.1 class I SAM-dependent methyltransferase [Leptospiraceae bacterium]